MGRCQCWCKFISKGYHQPCRQQFNIDMNNHWYGHDYKTFIFFEIVIRIFFNNVINNKFVYRCTIFYLHYLCSKQMLLFILIPETLNFIGVISDIFSSIGLILIVVLMKDGLWYLGTAKNVHGSNKDYSHFFFIPKVTHPEIGLLVS